MLPAALRLQSFATKLTAAPAAASNSFSPNTARSTTGCRPLYISKSRLSFISGRLYPCSIARLARAAVKSKRAKADEASSDALLKDESHLLLDQARISEGEIPTDPADFERRLSAIMDIAV